MPRQHQSGTNGQNRAKRKVCRSGIASLSPLSEMLVADRHLRLTSCFRSQVRYSVRTQLHTSVRSSDPALGCLHKARADGRTGGRAGETANSCSNAHGVPEEGNETLWVRRLATGFTLSCEFSSSSFSSLLRIFDSTSTSWVFGTGSFFFGFILFSHSSTA